jgi:hypothetical protein
MTLSSPCIVIAEFFPQSQTPLTKDKAGSTQVHALELTLALPLELMLPSHVTHLLRGFPTQTIDVMSLHPHNPTSYQLRSGFIGLQVHWLPFTTGAAVFAAAFLH